MQTWKLIHQSSKFSQISYGQSGFNAYFCIQIIKYNWNYFGARLLKVVIGQQWISKTEFHWEQHFNTTIIPINNYEAVCHKANGTNRNYELRNHNLTSFSSILCNHEFNRKTFLLLVEHGLWTAQTFKKLAKEQSKGRLDILSHSNDKI